MGYIKEPKNVDFYVIDKPWSEEEKKEFSALIKLHKERLKKQKKKTASKRKLRSTIRKKSVQK